MTGLACFSSELLSWSMRLISLGALRLEGEKFRREKPLLLLAYLTLEGPKPRRFLAELFWPEKDTPMNNFAVALDHLRKLGAANADSSGVWAIAPCDAPELREKLRLGQLEQAVTLYRGAFAEGLNLSDLGEELEEWLLATRETLARELRGALLRGAEAKLRESQHGHADPAQAGQYAELAYRLAGAPPPETPELARLYRLLHAAEHPLSQQLEREARDLGLPLTGPLPTWGRDSAPFVGRQPEKQKLLRLEPGQCAWVQGGPGLGKTALLHEVTAQGQGGWTVLPARSGLPYATLQPVLGTQPTDEPAESLLRRLTQHRQPLLLDDWDDMDTQSQQLIQRLTALKPVFPVILAGKTAPPLPVAVRLELGPLTPAELQDHPGAWHATAGIPALVSAFLRGDDPQAALQGCLNRLSELDRQVYTALALHPQADLSLIREALNLPPTELVAAYEHLMAASLIEASCQVRGPTLTEAYLRSEPTLTQHLSLKLARTLPTAQAMPLYQRAKPLWEAGDLKRVERAYQVWASDLLKRGQPKQAAETLQTAPHTPALTLLRARALERSNAFKQALDTLQETTDTPEILALRSRLLFKLGYPDRAAEAAQAALNAPDTLEAEAEALNTLGEIALRKGDAAGATDLFSRSATLWQAAGEKSRWLWALNNRAVARNALGEPTELVFQEVLDAAQDDLSVQAMVLNNMGNSYIRRQISDKAEEMYRRAIDVGSAAASRTPIIMAWNGLGIMFHSVNPVKARDAYAQGLKSCEGTGDAQLTAMLLANLAELDGDVAAWEQAIELLKRSGFMVLAADCEHQLESFMKR